LPPVSLNNFNDRVKKLSDNFRDLSLNLLTHQVDYDYIDYINLAECAVSDKKIITKSGVRYSTIVVPLTPALDSGSISMLLKAADNGVPVILQGSDSILTETESSKDFAASVYKTLCNHKNVLKADNIKGVTECVKQVSTTGGLILNQPNDKIIYTARQNGRSIVYMLVNVSKDQQEINAVFKAQSKRIKVWDPYKGNTYPINSEDKENGVEIRGLQIGAEKTLFLTFEP
jgi:hypothetical protein